jgi:uncharacterized protein YjbI with pentapeptide repeats
LKPYSFVGAKFANCDASESQAQGVNFSRADLSLANFRLANLKRANLSGCRASDTDLSGTLLVGTNFTDASLEEADLRFARAIGADFTRASLAGADLANADFSEATFKKTKVWGATAHRLKAPGGMGMMFSLSTMFHKAKQKATKVADVKQQARDKRIAELEAEADQKAPHQTGRR